MAQGFFPPAAGDRLTTMPVGNGGDNFFRGGPNLFQAHDQNPQWGGDNVPDYMRQLFDNYQRNQPPQQQQQQNEMYAGMGHAAPQTPFGPSQMPVPGGPGGGGSRWEDQLNPLYQRAMQNDPEAMQQLGWGESGPLGAPDFVRHPGNPEDWQKRYLWLGGHQELGMRPQPTDSSRFAMEGAINYDKFLKNAMAGVNANRLPNELAGTIDPNSAQDLMNKYYYQQVNPNLGAYNDPNAYGSALQNLYERAAQDQGHDYYLANLGGNLAMFQRAMQNGGNMPRPPMPAPRGYGGGGGGGGNSYGGGGHPGSGYSPPGTNGQFIPQGQPNPSSYVRGANGELGVRYPNGLVYPITGPGGSPLPHGPASQPGGRPTPAQSATNAAMNVMWGAGGPPPQLPPQPSFGTAGYYGGNDWNGGPEPVPSTPANGRQGQIVTKPDGTQAVYDGYGNLIPIGNTPSNY